MNSFYNCKKCKACCQVLNILLGTKNRHLCCLVVMEHIVYTSRDYEKKPISFFEEISPPIRVTRTKKGQIESKYGINLFVSYWLMIWATYSIFKSFYLISIYSQPVKFNHPTYRKLWSSQSPTTESSGPDSVTIAVNDLDQNITISSQEIPLAAWQLLLSRRQDFLNNHLARFPITPNQEGTMEMRDEVLSSVGAQDLDTSSCQVSDLEDIEFNWEDSQLDAVFRPGIDTPFSPTTFDDLSMGGSVENPIVLDEEQDKENSPPIPSTPESVRPTEPPRLQRSRPFVARIENVPDYVSRNLFQ